MGKEKETINVEEAFKQLQAKTLERQEHESKMRALSEENRKLNEKLKKSKEYQAMRKNRSEASSLARFKGKVQKDMDDIVLGVK